MRKIINQTVIIRRDDFKLFSDGNSIFDSILESLGIEKIERVYEVTIDMADAVATDIYNEDGKRLFRLDNRVA